MNVGMLWFDNDPKKMLTIKVLEAAAYYRMKYNRWPDVCLVNPGVISGAQLDIDPVHENGGRIIVKPLRSILPGHLWIGVDEKMTEAR